MYTLLNMENYCMYSYTQGTAHVFVCQMLWLGLLVDVLSAHDEVIGGDKIVIYSKAGVARVPSMNRVICQQWQQQQWGNYISNSDKSYVHKQEY